MEHPQTPLNQPWLVAVWPGMGNVALAAGGYLLDQLDVFELPLPDLREFFDVDEAAVKDGVVRRGRFPRNRLYGWRDPAGRRDLLVFVGESQPNVRSYGFCHTLLDLARTYDVERVVTFASMVTPQLGGALPNLFSVATDARLLKQVLESGVESAALEDGVIGGLNGTLLAAAAELDVDGIGLLAEVPAMAIKVPYLRSAQRVLELFGAISGVKVDLTLLSQQADRLEESIREMLIRIRKLAASESDSEGAGESPTAETLGLPGPLALPEVLHQEASTGPPLTPEVVALIESLFLLAEADRSKVWELKDELERQGLFKAYQDRFLDLF